MLRDLIKFDLLRRIAGQGKQEATHVLFLCLKQAANILPVDGKLVRIHKEKELRKLDDLDVITRKMKVFSAPDHQDRRKSGYR